jgi:hypothetical protein
MSLRDEIQNQKWSNIYDGKATVEDHYAMIETLKRRSIELNDGKPLYMLVFCTKKRFREIKREFRIKIYGERHRHSANMQLQRLLRGK